MKGKLKLNFKPILLILIFLKSSIISFQESKFDVTVIGRILYADGLGRLPIGFIENFNDKLKINFIKRGTIDLNCKDNFKKINKNAKEIIEKEFSEPGNVCILFDALWIDKSKNFPYIPKSLINIAYSMFESTAIPKEWVKFLNKKFDMIVVPSKFLIKVYKKSGIKRPIFWLPHGIYIDDFLDKPIKTKANNPFVFACFANFYPHKNQKFILESFLNKFKNNKNVILKFYSNGGITLKENIKIVEKNNIDNVEFITGSLSPEDYLNEFSSIDCCITLSKAEGYSVRPREAAALGIPTIISNNTAHKDLSDLPFFIPVKSTEKSPADYTFIFGSYYGYNFESSKEEFEQALLNVYSNYNYYLEKSSLARQWVNQFTYKSLEKKYLNLIKPEEIILSDKNEITDDYLMTNSKELYEKYLILKSLNQKI